MKIGCRSWRALVPILLLSALASCAIEEQSLYRLGGVTDSQISEITPIIHKATPERILGFRRQPNGIIQVETGDHGPQGTGQGFRLRKSRGRWKIIEEYLWNA